MSIKGNILYEYHLDETLAKYREVPEVAKQQFIDKLIPSDIILSKTTETDPSWSGVSLLNLKNMLMRDVQGSPLNSCKLYMGKGEVAGYGVIPGSKGSSGIMKNNLYHTLNNFMDSQRRILVVRPKEFTKEQRLKAISFIKNRIGLGYDSSILLKSAWHRFIHKHNLVDIDPNDPILNDLKTPLICSSLIAFSIIASGNSTRFGSNPYEIWPVDLLMSDQVDLICRFNRSE